MSSKQKILFIDLNILYMNPTRNLIPGLLSIHYDLYIFGPGYQSDEILDKGIERYAAEFGPFDFIVSNEHVCIFFPESSDEFKKKYIPMFKSNFYSNFDLEKRHLEDMYNYFLAVKHDNKILFLLEFDYYWISVERMKLVEDIGAYIVGFGDQLITCIDEMNHLCDESFSELVNDRWFEYVSNSNKIIQLPHFIDYSEFAWESAIGRKYECSVPGVGYWARKVAFNGLKHNKIKMPKNIHNKLFHVLSTMGVSVYSNRWLLNQYASMFNNIIKDSMSAFTCGSALDWPIRKFFEIPAKGTVLIAKPFKSFEELGFIDGENCIVSKPDSIYSVILDLRNNPELVCSISENGRKMILDTHSINARADQLKLAFDRIVKSTFKGSYWRAGRFYVK